jgi:hypothetical protein
MSPTAERAVIGVFMAGVAIEAAAQQLTGNTGAIAEAGAIILKIAGFSIGNVVLIAAAYRGIENYFRRKL